MITKRPASFEMPNLKRCKLEEAEAKAYEYFRSGSSGYDESFSAAVGLESNLQRKALNQSPEKFRRSARGRPQVVPSRFKDSGELCEKKQAKHGGKKNCAKKKEVMFRPHDFALGDIVWAKCGRRYRLCPAVVIDPIVQAPDAVLGCRIPNSICVMFFGFSKNGTQRDYGWVKQGKIYPFKQFLERFRGQTQLYRSKPSEFQMAIEEAVLAENGFVYPPCKATDSEANVTEIQEATDFYQDQAYHSQNQEALLKDTRPCDCCGLINPSKALKKVKGSGSETQVLCKHCAKLRKSKQYCGICKMIWHHSDGGDWVCCDGCNVWVHAECDKISSKVLEDPEHNDYYCPDCKNKSKCELSDVVHCQQKPRSGASSRKSVTSVTVVCNGMEGTYVRSLHMVACKCGSCDESEMRSLGKWERHTGCRTKHWKHTVKVKATMQTLEQWIAKYGLQPLTLDKKRLLDFLKEKYEPVNAKWTTERCAVCRWVEDWEDNKMIICSRCQIAVHQECYGAKDVQDFTSWVCRACETPDIIRECCLCPVKGGALKPTDVDTFWVHVSCAWFRPEVAFLNHEQMEPAVGILRIPPTSFMKRCVICTQTHGSCTRCCKCATHFHATCASRAGYSMELHGQEKKGKQVTAKLIYCAWHRKPKPDAVVVVT
ncbi:hypothetical protein ACLB2K_069452 [Fragaria x ananassa]